MTIWVFVTLWPRVPDSVSRRGAAAVTSVVSVTGPTVSSTSTRTDCPTGTPTALITAVWKPGKATITR